jgi:hypothetical protein
MTELEAYELATRGGATAFHRLIDVCESFGPYCLIGDFAVSWYVEPEYAVDADIVVIASNLPKLRAQLEEQGFRTEEHPHSVNVSAPESGLRIQFTTDERYQAFPARAAEVLGVRVKVACLEDIIRGKL